MSSAKDDPIIPYEPQAAPLLERMQALGLDSLVDTRDGGGHGEWLHPEL